MAQFFPYQECNLLYFFSLSWFVSFVRFLCIPVYFLREGEHFIISSFTFHLGRKGKNWEGGHLITLFLFIIIILLYSFCLFYYCYWFFVFTYHILIFTLGRALGGGALGVVVLGGEHWEVVALGVEHWEGEQLGVEHWEGGALGCGSIGRVVALVQQYTCSFTNSVLHRSVRSEFMSQTSNWSSWTSALWAFSFNLYVHVFVQYVNLM